MDDNQNDPLMQPIPPPVDPAIWTWPKLSPSRIVDKVSDVYYIDEDGDAIIPTVLLGTGIMIHISRPKVLEVFQALKKAGKPPNPTIMDMFCGEGPNTDKSDSLDENQFEESFKFDQNKIVAKAFPAMNAFWLTGDPIDKLVDKIMKRGKSTLAVSDWIQTIVGNVWYRESLRPPGQAHYMFAELNMETVEKAWKESTTVSSS